MNRKLGLAFAALACATSAEAADLRFGHFLPSTHPLQVGFDAWAEQLNEDSGGSLSIQFFPGAQLGAANDHYDMTKTGIVDLAWIAIGYTPGLFPVAELIDVPFAIPGEELQATRALNDWYAPIGAEEMSDVKMCFVHLMPAGYLHTKEEVKTPADANGLRVRPASAAVSTYVTRMGNTTVPMPVTEAQQAIERGVADAITLAYHSVELYGIDKSLTHHLDLPLYYPGGAVVMNKASYERLSDEEKAAVDGLCSGDGAVLATSPWHEWEAKGRGIIEAKGGHTFYTPTDAEAAEWEAAAEPVLAQWKELVKEAGRNPDELLEELYGMIEAQN